MKKAQYKREVEKHKINSVCNTLISTLFVVLISLLGLFICDLTGLIHLNQPIQYVQAAMAIEDSNPDLTFISASQTNTYEPALVGQETQKKQTTIIKPLIDHRQYKYIELPNKLKVLLIHDKELEVASAALDVKVGSWNEPDAFPGLAHFCEHMLFIGSKKYPQTGYFDDIMASGGGYSNAYTESTNTNYYFEITIDHLEKALDAFAHFFIDPLFSDEAVGKERNAVNSEYEIDVNTEDWKVVNLFSLLADSNHPASRFSIGNNDVLAKDGVVDALRQFYDENYSANLMALSIQSSMPLKDMEQLIRKGSFRNIPNKSLKQKVFEGSPYQMGQLGKFKSEKKQIIMNWQLSGRDEYLHSKPLEFIDYFINGNYQNSLKNYLLDSQVIIQLESSVFIEEHSFVNYIIELTLPDQKLEDKTAILEVARVVNNYIQQLEEWLKDDDYLHQVFLEQSQVSKINFEYMEGQQEMSQLAKNLNKFQAEEVLSANFIMDKFEKEGIYKYLEEMKKTENILILLSDNQFEFKQSQESKESKENNKQFLNNNELTKRSDIYHLDYDLQTISKETQKYITGKDKKLQQKFSKPPTNEFIPQDLSLVSLCQSNSDKLPPLLHGEQLNPLNKEQKLQLFYSTGQDLQQVDDDNCKSEELQYIKNNHYPTLLNTQGNQWWKISTNYKLPTVFGAIQYKFIQWPDLQEYTALRLYNYMIEDQVQKQLNQPLTSGYVFSLDISKQMEIKVYGFSEKIRNFFNKICSCMNPFKEKSFLQLNDSPSFLRAQQSFITQLKEIFQMKLFEQSVQIYLNKLAKKQFYDPQQLLDQIPLITESQMQTTIKKYLNKVQQNTLLVGNLDSQAATDINQDLQSCASNENQLLDTFKEQIINLKGQNLLYSAVIQADQGDINGATLNYYQIGPRVERNYALMKILQPLLNAQAYNYLRTDLQLGYVVAMKFKHIGCVDGAIFLVQGSKEVPFVVDNLIEDFLLKFDDYLTNLSKKEFQHVKHSTIIELRQNPQSVTEEGERLWEYIQTGDLLFEERHQTIEQIKSVTRKDIHSFFKQVFLEDKQKLSIQLYGEGMYRETLNLQSEKAFQEFVSKHKTSQAQLYSESEIKYYECENDVTAV